MPHLAVRLLFALVGLLPQLGAQVAPEDPCEAMARLPAAATPERGTKITVRHADGTTCPQAVVFAMPRLDEASERLVRRRASARYPSDPLRSLALQMITTGTRLAVDERGGVRIDAHFTGTLAAIAGDRAGVIHLGSDRLDGGRSPLSVTLASITWATVRVLTKDGTPAADVPLGIDDAYGTLPGSVVCTAKDGSARVPLLPTSPEMPSPFVVRVLAPLAPPLARAITGIEDHPIEFTLPACGSLDVEVKGLPDGAVPNVELIERAMQGIGSRTAFRPGLPCSIDATRARFSHIPTGTALLAEVTLGSVATPVVVPVPQVSEGQCAKLVVDLQSEMSWARARVLTADGVPVANQLLTVRELRNSGIASTPVLSDVEGRIEYCTESPSDRPGLLRIEHGRDRRKDRALGSVTTVVPPRTQGRNDLGDLRLGIDPIVCRGRIVDAQQQPLAGVVLATRHLDATYESSASAADGSFVLRLPPPTPSALSLTLSYDSNCIFSGDAPEGPLTIGSGSETQIVVQPCGELLLGFVPPLPPLANAVRAEFQDHDHPTQLRGRTLLVPGARLLRLPAGRWDLALRAWNQTLFSLDTVQVDPGVENHDARLLRIDWTAFGHLVALRVELPDGTPYDDCEIHVWYPQSGGIASDTVPMHSSACHLLLPNNATRVAIQPRDPRWRPQDLANLKAPELQIVRLAPAIRVALTLRGLPKPPDGMHWEARLYRNTTATPLVTIAADGRVVLYAPDRGNATLSFVLQHGNQSVDCARSASVEVGVQDIDRELAIEGDLADALAAAIAQAQAR